MLSLFDSNSDYLINKIEFTTMLDSVGSTLSEDAIDTVYADSKSGDLSYEEIVDHLEKALFSNKTSVDPNRLTVSDKERLIDIQNCPICQKT